MIAEVNSGVTKPTPWTDMTAWTAPLRTSVRGSPSALRIARVGVKSASGPPTTPGG